MATRITEDDVLHWAELYVEQKVAIAAIAERCGRSTTTIRRHLAEAGFTDSKPGPHTVQVLFARGPTRVPTQGHRRRGRS